MIEWWQLTSVVAKNTLLLVFVYLVITGCKEEEEKMKGCLFTFAGKEYKSDFVLCTEIADPNWNPSSNQDAPVSTYLISRVSENDRSWELRLNDEKDWAVSFISFEDLTRCQNVQEALTKAVSFNNGTFTFIGSNFQDFYGNECEGEIRGKCGCPD